MVAGVCGAVLVAALVLARGGQSELVTLEQFQNEGGVAYVRAELFMRQSGTVGTFGPQVFESWYRNEGDGVEIILANHTLDGVLLGRGRGSQDDIESETVEDGRVVAWPRLAGYGTATPGDMSAEDLAEVVALMREQGLEQVASLRDGTLRFVGLYPRLTAGTTPTPGHPAYPSDLDVVTVEQEWLFGPNLGQQRIRFQAILEDGSRVLIASRRHDYSLLPLSEWDAIEELVWGN
jgi:hypothetical protein